MGIGLPGAGTGSSGGGGGGGGGTPTPLADTTPRAPGTAAAGTATAAARGDHVHPLPTGAQLESAIDSELGSSAWKGGDTVVDGGEQSTVVAAGISATVNNGNAQPVLADCSEDIKADELYEVTIAISGRATSIGYFSGAAVVALTQRFSSAPDMNNPEAGISIKLSWNVQDANDYGHTGLNVWRHADDDKLWIAHGRSTGSVTIRRIARGAGAAAALAPVVSPAAEDGTVGQIVNVAGNLQIVKRRHGSDPTVLWQTYTPGTDVSTLWGESTGTYRWRGKHPRGSSVSSPAVGDVFVTAEGAFERYSTTGAVGWWHLDAPTGWLGVFATETNAEYQVTAVEDVAVWGSNIHRVTTFTAGTQERYVLRGLFADLPRTFLDLSDTPAAFGSAGDRIQVNTTGDGVEFFTPSSTQQVSGERTEVRDLVTVPVGLSGNALSEQFTDGTLHWNAFVFTEAVPKVSIRLIEVHISIQSRFDVRFLVGPGDVRLIGGYDGATWPWTGQSDRIPCLYWSGENDSVSDKRDPVFTRPSFFQVNARRQNGLESLFLFLSGSGDDLTGFRILYSGSITTQVVRATLTRAVSD